MAIFHHAIDVSASPEQCWQVFRDLPGWPRWFPRLVNVVVFAPPSADALAVGAELDLVIAAGPLGTKNVRITVQESVAATRVRWTGSMLGVKINHWYSLEVRAPGTTRFTSHEEVKGVAARIIMRGKIFDHIDQEAHASLAKFKQLVENQANA